MQGGGNKLHSSVLIAIPLAMPENVEGAGEQDVHCLPHGQGPLHVLHCVEVSSVVIAGAID